jgi:hypothetical protein
MERAARHSDFLQAAALATLQIGEKDETPRVYAFQQNCANQRATISTRSSETHRRRLNNAPLAGIF